MLHEGMKKFSRIDGGFSVCFDNQPVKVVAG
jgi:hypothetical protein